MAKVKKEKTSAVPDKPKDILTPEEMAKFPENFYEPGHPYLWVLTFGWCLVGFYLKHSSPVHLRLAHANYYNRAGKTHAELALEGGGPETSWRYVGENEITATHVLHVMKFYGEVPREPIKSSS